MEHHDDNDYNECSLRYKLTEKLFDFGIYQPWETQDELLKIAWME